MGLLLFFFFSLGAATLLFLPVFCFWAKFRQLATQKTKKKVQCNAHTGFYFFRKFSKHSPYFLEKGKKIARFRQ
jgi:hypothetical protein